MMSIVGKSYLFVSNIVGIVLGSVIGTIIIGLALYFLIVKLQKRNKKVKIDTKVADYQFEFRLNTGNFLNKLKDESEVKKTEEEVN